MNKVKCEACGKEVDYVMSFKTRDGKTTRQICSDCFKKATTALLENLRRKRGEKK